MAKNGLPYYPRFPRDFIEGTIGLPFEVKAAYGLVLDMIYLKNGKLPDDPRYIAGLLNVSVRKWNSLRKSLLAAEKLFVSDGLLMNYRAIIEVEKLGKLQDNNAEKAAKRWKNKDLADAAAMLRAGTIQNQIKKEPLPTVVVPKKKTSLGSRIPEDFQPLTGPGLDQGLTEQETQHEADKFRDYWLGVAGAKGTKLDWPATWRNWCRRAGEDRKNRRGSNGNGKMTGVQAVLAAAAEIDAELDEAIAAENEPPLALENHHVDKH